HMLPSRQKVPLVSATCVHPVAGMHVSVVHALLSVQSRAVPAVHTPPWQVSVPLQVLPAGHGVPLKRPVDVHEPALQVLVVHGFPSSQSAFTPHVWQPPMTVWMQ